MNSTEITQRLDQWVGMRTQLPLTVRRHAARAARIRRLFEANEATTGALLDVKA